MIVLPYKRLFQKYVAVCGEYVAYGPTRGSAIARVLGMIEAHNLI